MSRNSFTGHALAAAVVRAEAIGPPFRVEREVISSRSAPGNTWVCSGPEQGGQSDDEEVERTEQARLAAVTKLVTDEPFLRIDVEEDISPHAQSSEAGKTIVECRRAATLPRPTSPGKHDRQACPEQILRELPDKSDHDCNYLHHRRVRVARQVRGNKRPATGISPAWGVLSGTIGHSGSVSPHELPI